MPHPAREMLGREEAQRVNPVPQMGFAAREEERHLEQQHQEDEPKPRLNKIYVTKHRSHSSHLVLLSNESLEAMRAHTSRHFTAIAGVFCVDA